MTNQHTAVIGVYSNATDADHAVYELLMRASLIVEVSVRSVVVAGAMVGGLIGALAGATGNSAAPVRGESAQRNIVLAVHCASSEDIERARTLLRQTGAEDITETPEPSSGDRPVIL
jgi:hypothetical protein